MSDFTVGFVSGVLTLILFQAAVIGLAVWLGRRAIQKVLS